jgi:hypothetical protein
MDIHPIKFKPSFLVSNPSGHRAQIEISVVKENHTYVVKLPLPSLLISHSPSNTSHCLGSHTAVAVAGTRSFPVRVWMYINNNLKCHFTHHNCRQKQQLLLLQTVAQRSVSSHFGLKWRLQTNVQAGVVTIGLVRAVVAYTAMPTPVPESIASTHQQ